MNQKNKIKLIATIGVLSLANSCTNEWCWTFVWHPLTYAFKSCRCVIARGNLGDNCGDNGGVQGPFCKLADGTNADNPTCCSDLTPEDQQARLMAGNTVPECTSNCTNMRVTATGFPPENCPQPPIKDEQGIFDQGTENIIRGLRGLDDAEELLGTTTIDTTAPQAATASSGGKTPKTSKPVTLPARPSTVSDSGSGGAKGNAGGLPGFGSGTTTAATVDSAPKDSMEMETSGGMPEGGGGTGAKKNLLSGSGSFGAGDLAAPGEGKSDVVNFSGVKGDQLYPEDPAYWDRIAKEMSLFRVVTLRYIAVDKKWALEAADKAARRVLRRSK